MLLIFFYILVLLQTTFLVYFNIFGILPNFVVLAVILLNFFEKPAKKTGVIIAFFAGFFLDAFSGRFFGYYTLICLASAILIKYILKRYIRIWT